MNTTLDLPGRFFVAHRSLRSGDDAFPGPTPALAVEEAREAARRSVTELDAIA